MFNHLNAGLFEETPEQIERRKIARAYIDEKREWGLRSRDQWTSASCRVGQMTLSSNSVLYFHETPGQQQRLWDCALIMCQYMYFELEKHYLSNRNVIELGCGLGLPGVCAALLGANHVTLTDMPKAMASIQRTIALNHASVSSDRLEAMPLMWSKSLNWGKQYDLILCSDLIYGDVASSELLIHTIDELCHPQSLVLMVFETRIAGDQGRSFFEGLDARGFIAHHVELAACKNVYQSRNIHVVRLAKKDSSLE